MTRPQILVIDDDPLFRSLLTAMLCKDFVVTTASDGAEGYYLALKQQPHLAIVDIMMPGWDGLKTLKAFRAHYLLAHLPIMVLTSDSSRQTVMAALQAGANDYVLKTTLSRDDFIRKVCRQLNVEPATHPTADDVAGGDDGEAERVKSDGIVPVHQPEQLAVANPANGRSDRLFDDGALQALIDDWE